MSTNKFRLLVLRALLQIVSGMGGYYNNKTIDILEEGIDELKEDIKKEEEK